MHAAARTLVTLLCLALLACCSGGGGSTGPYGGPTDDAAAGNGTPDPTGDAGTPAPDDAEGEGPDDEGAEDPEAGPTRPTSPARLVSVPGLAEQEHRGDRLRVGRVRERTGSYTSYDVTYRSRSTTPRGEESFTISGVLNVPAGEGPFPAVVLAHGYIDPAVYEQGQGMTRERGYLAGRGYVALHVDYRNHGGSDDDPRVQDRMRLGYSADVINAVKALRATDEVPVDDDRIAFMGRSMGGGVVLKALAAEPGLVAAAALWASVSSREAENYEQFIAPDPADASLRDRLARRHGTPAENPRFWRENSSRPYFDEISEPVLLVHGRYDDTCPPRWARATRRALTAAGVDAALEWYDDGHAFGPAFIAAMDRTVRFLRANLDEATASGTTSPSPSDTGAFPSPDAAEPPRSYLTIPALGMQDFPVVRYRGTPDDAEGTRIQDAGPLASPRGPGGGVGPGRVGNFIVTGHRVSGTKPFLDLPALAVGDRVRVRSGDQVHVYQIVTTRRTSFRSRRSLREQAAAVPGHPGAEPARPMITLSTCATPEDHAAGNYWSDEFGNPEHRIDKIGALVG